MNNVEKKKSTSLVTPVVFLQLLYQMSASM